MESIRRHAHMKIWKWCEWDGRKLRALFSYLERILDRRQSFHTSYEHPLFIEKLLKSLTLISEICQSSSSVSANVSASFITSFPHTILVEYWGKSKFSIFFCVRLTREIKNVLEMHEIKIKTLFFSCELNSVSHSNATQMSNKRENWMKFYIFFSILSSWILDNLHFILYFIFKVSSCRDIPEQWKKYFQVKSSRKKYLIGTNWNPVSLKR